jgi:hypothetical protein
MYIARFKPISNQSDWRTAILFNDRATGTPIDMTGISFTMQISLIGRYYNLQNSAGSTMTLSTATGELTNPSLGILQIIVLIGRMQGMMPGTYDVGLQMTNNVITVQTLLGKLPIVNGIIGSGTATNPWGDDYA